MVRPLSPPRSQPALFVTTDRLTARTRRRTRFAGYEGVLAATTSELEEGLGLLAIVPCRDLGTVLGRGFGC